MIKINEYSDDTKKWYLQEMLPVICEKREALKVRCGDSDTLVSDLQRELASLQDEEIATILICRYPEEQVSDDKEYGFLRRTPVLKSHLEKCYAQSTEKDEKFERNNSEIKELFDYSYLDSTIKHQLYFRLGIRVCPYCNQQYVYSLGQNEDDDEFYMGDLDHFLLKSVFQLFSLSIWNFVPSCKVCNGKFAKGTKQVKLMDPTKSGFGDYCKFKIPYDNVRDLLGESKTIPEGKWEIDVRTPDDIKQLIEKNCEVFKLDMRYQGLGTVIKDTLYKRQIFAGEYSKSIDGLLHKLGDMSVDQTNRLKYGASLNPDNFQEELLSKMIYDLIKG